VAVAAAVCRFVEHHLARNTVYRISRHVIRLVLFGGLTLHIIQEATGMPMDLTSVDGLRMALGIPANLGIVLAAVAGMQWLLWKGERAREFWHRRLVAVGLRKEELAEPPAETETTDLPVKPIWD
jgi:hypothetical protein